MKGYMDKRLDRIKDVLYKTWKLPCVSCTRLDIGKHAPNCLSNAAYEAMDDLDNYIESRD